MRQRQEAGSKMDRINPSCSRPVGTIRLFHLDLPLTHESQHTPPPSGVRWTRVFMNFR